MTKRGDVAFSHLLVAILALDLAHYGSGRITDPLVEEGGFGEYCYPGQNPQCEDSAQGKFPLETKCHSDAGKMQSGIDIPYASDDKFKKIELASSPAYVKLRSFAMGNNGHTVSIRMNNGDDFLIGGPMVNSIVYTLDSIHFHWSSSATGDQGNEHHIFGKSIYPLEIHLVHYKKKFEDLLVAIRSKEPDALTVISVPCTVGGLLDNKWLAPVVKHLKDVITYKQTTTGEGLVVRELFAPAVTNNKYFHMARYQGSLTTPTCDEVVRWLVLIETFSISRKQLDEFRKLKDGAGYPLVDNIRPVQPLNGRVVEYFDVTTTTKSTADLQSSGFSITHLRSRELSAIISAMLIFVKLYQITGQFK